MLSHIVSPTPTEPDDADRKKKTLKNKIKVSKASHNDSKPNISYPTNFEHTVHVGFDAITGEFTVSTHPPGKRHPSATTYIPMYILHFGSACISDRFFRLKVIRCQLR